MILEKVRNMISEQERLTGYKPENITLHPYNWDELASIVFPDYKLYGGMQSIIINGVRIIRG